MDRGFKVQFPYGCKNFTFYVSCCHYRAPRPGCDDPEPCGNLTKKKQRHCPFSLIFKKHMLGHESSRSIHPAVTFNPQDPKDSESLSQSQGVGIYYMAKFRGLHNHAMEMNLMQGEWHQQSKSDVPLEVSRRFERYTHVDRRWHMEKAVMAYYEEMARKKIITINNESLQFGETGIEKCDDSIYSIGENDLMITPGGNLKAVFFHIEECQMISEVNREPKQLECQDESVKMEEIRGKLKIFF